MTLKQALWEIVRDENINKTADWYFEIDKTGIVINTSNIHSFNKNYDYHLGETAFLTKQEAEQALANMKGSEKQ